MHNIHELEKRWLSYKIKSYIPHVLILFSIITGIVLFLNVDIKNKDFIVKKEILIIEPTKEIEIIKKDVLKVEIKEQNKVALLKEIDIEQIEKKVVLTPSFDFIKKLRNNSTNSYKSNSFPVTKQQENVQIATKNPVTLPAVKEKIIKKKTEEKKKKIQIFKQETQADIEHVIKRFQKNNNPALSLFVAKKYYRLGEYEKSYNYALITNELNNNIDQSWIIFAKSLVKLNKKDKAIKVLNRYVKHSHSSNAKMLLDDIHSGKFK